MTDCRLDLIRDDQLKWVPLNFRRIMDWADCVQDELDTLAEAIDGGSP